MRTFTADTAAPLLETLLKAFPDTPRTRVKQSLTHGGVLVNGQPVTRYDYPLQVGDKINLGFKRSEEGLQVPEFGVRVLYEDELLAVIDKPAGLLTVATDTVRDRTAIYALNDYLNRRENLKRNPRDKMAAKPVRRKLVFVVHRLDRDASGVLVFAKTQEVKEWLQANWDKFVKVYAALVEGAPQPPEGKVESYLKENKILRVVSGPKSPGSKWAATHYRTLKSVGDYSLLEVRLETGRKHQIRVHMADLGCPIAGDKDYGAQTNPARRLALHARRLEIRHPETGKKITFESPLPQELEKCL